MSLFKRNIPNRNPKSRKVEAAKVVFVYRASILCTVLYELIDEAELEDNPYLDELLEVFSSGAYAAAGDVGQTELYEHKLAAFVRRIEPFKSNNHRVNVYAAIAAFSFLADTAKGLKRLSRTLDNMLTAQLKADPVAERFAIDMKGRKFLQKLCDTVTH